MKKAMLLLAAFITLLALLLVPDWCSDKFLRHTFEQRTLLTPGGPVTDIDQTTRWWGVEYSDFADDSFENAYRTPENRRIVSIRPTAAPALTVGFHIEVRVYAADAGVVVEPDLSQARVTIGQHENVPVTLTANSSRETRDSHRGTLFLSQFNYQIDNEIIEQLDIETGEIFEGEIPFSIDGENYSFRFSSIMRHEKRSRSCFGVPGMP